MASNGRVSIQVDQKQVDSLHALLDDIKNGAENAIRRALNATLDGAVALTAQRIAGKTTLKSGYIKDHITKVKAKNYKLGAAMRMESGKVPLAAFQTAPTAANFQARDAGNGVSVKVWRDKGAVRFRHAFFAVMQNGYVGLFERDIDRSRAAAGTDSRGRPRKNRLPLNELMGPYLRSIYEKTPGLSTEVETTSAERLQRELERQTDYLLGLKK